jgi:hypothetical protein
MMTLPRDHPVLTDYAVSDEAAAYIANALMELALEFEATHLAQIRRHHESLKPEPNDQQLDLFANPRHSERTAPLASASCNDV